MSYGEPRRPGQGPIYQQPGIESMRWPYDNRHENPLFANYTPSPEVLASLGRPPPPTTATPMPPTRPPQTYQPRGPWTAPADYTTGSLPVFKPTPPLPDNVVRRPKPSKVPKPDPSAPPFAASSLPGTQPIRTCANCSAPLAGSADPYTANLPCKHAATCTNPRCLKAYYGAPTQYALPYADALDKPLHCQTQGCGARIEAWCKVDCFYESGNRVVNIARRDTETRRAEERRQKEERRRHDWRVEEEDKKKEKEEKERRKREKKERDRDKECCDNPCNLGPCAIWLICCHECLCCCSGLKEIRDF